MLSQIVFSALAVCQIQVGQLPVGSWPSFLGVGGSWASSTTASGNLPQQWSPVQGISWQAELVGHGQSSPVAWGDRLFFTSVAGAKKDQYFVSCLSLKNGAQLWQQTVQNGSPVENSLYVSRAAPTPVVDGQQLVAVFESGNCIALDHDGNILWQRDLNQTHGPFIAEFGLGASPCQDADRVFVLLEHDGPSHLIALDKRTGELAWAAPRGPRRSWSSPMLIEIANEKQIVVSSAGSIDGYEPTSGKLLWSFSDIGGNTGTTPLDCGAGKFLVGASPGRQGENAAQAATSNCLMQIDREGTGWQVTKLWHNADASPSWASPILHRGLAYWVNRVGVVCCINAETGQTVYQGRSKQSCWATPFAVGDRIYLFGKDGLTTVIAAGETFKILAENRLWPEDAPPPDASLQTQESTAERQKAAAMFSGPTVYGYAVVGAQFIIRIGNRVYCVGE